MIRTIVYPPIPILYVLNLFLNNTIIDFIIMILAIIAILISLSNTQSLYLWSSIFFLLTGILIFFLYDLDINDLVPAFKPMMGLLGLFLVLPFIQAVIKIGKYDKSLNKLIKYRIQRVDGIYRRTSFCTYLLAIFLTIATLPIGVQSFNKLIPSMKGQAKQIFFTHSMLRAYSMALFWSPVELLVVASIDQLNANYLDILPTLLGISISYLLLDWMLQRKKYNYPLDHESLAKQTKISKKDIKTVLQLFLGIFLLLVTVILGDLYLKKGLLISIVLIIVPFSLIWAFFIKKSWIFFLYLKRHTPNNINNTNNFHVLFLSAGFFITMIQHSSIFDWIRTLMIHNFNSLNLFVFLLLLIGAFWILSLSGFHSVVTITLFAEILRPISGGLENTLALIFIGSTIPLLMVSPFNLATSMMSNLIHASPFKILLWNFRYALSFSIYVVLIAYSLLYLS